MNLFIIHLKELKHRIYYIFYSLALCILYCAYNWELLLYSFIKILNENKSIKKYIILDNFMYTNVMDIFFNVILFCLIISILVNIPLLIFHILSFFVTGLYKYEFKNYLIISIFSIFCIILSILVSYKNVLPSLYAFFLNLNEIENNNLFSLNFEIHIDDIIQLIYKVTLLGLIISQLPLLIYLLYFLNFCGIGTLLKLKNIIILLMFSLINLMMPLDLLNAIFTYITIMLLYELSIFTIIFIEINKQNFNER